MNGMLYENRQHAGQLLGKLVAALPEIAGGIVLGLVRGGVPVASEVARECRLPLDIMAVRKLHAPGQRELAMGAIASGGGVALNQDVLRECRVSDRQLEQAIEHEKDEMARQESGLREGRRAPQIAGRTVILVDDGLATGATVRAAIRSVKLGHAKKVIVAVPVGAASTCDELTAEVDSVVCPLKPDWMFAVSQFYADFGQTTNEDVRRLLVAAAQAPE
ncbi:MAG: phosphoribosyltransferase [Acidobacteriota bacterium]|nr:phosphoribosyltransferase [Acidobacteriota bacterium]